LKISNIPTNIPTSEKSLNAHARVVNSIPYFSIRVFLNIELSY